ncbi:MAG TPA: GcrA family cell cycle regulator [Acetobacteraceae bacterium]|nr:GcrA family cell cycle regulator [Acetobacteraceae bacterium]
MMMSSFDWNDVVIGRLRSLWEEGHSTAEIGRRLGVSKNAVVGKAHRLDLPDRPSPIRRDFPPKPRPAPRPPPTLPPLPSLGSAPAPVVAKPVPPQATEWRPAALRPSSVRPLGTRVIPCCWPIGHPGKPGFRFCEQGSVAGRPYCAQHCMLAYAKKRKAA